ncbi:hypothetical protein ACFQJ7_12185 [Halovenus rubra]|uniref:Uncharacterized protein n=2 Tax=Halovenus rubra TaxID=869890 RepID=A0ACC7E218_9EURY|nr:hypothetical protein [Halovenus rubra]
MEREIPEKWVGNPGPPSGALIQNQILKPPYGYVIGIIIWPIFLSIISVSIAMSLQIGFFLITSLIVVVGGPLTIISSACVLSITAWNTPDKQIQQYVAVLTALFFLSVPLFYLWATTGTVFLQDRGLSAFAAHELIRIVFLGPAIGFVFVVFSLMIFASRYRRN